MSAPGPEAIPTSADPRSHRPLKKKRALSPASVQASQLSHLFAHPDTEIRLPPTSGVPARTLPAPPEIVTNVQGSSAGAGSGEFHVYKAARRREYERLRLMDDEVAKEKAAAEFEATRKEREARDAEKTRKNREKREKKKMKGKAGAKSGGSTPAPSATKTNGQGGKGKKEAGIQKRAHSDDGEIKTSTNAPEEAKEGAASASRSEAPATVVVPTGLVIHDDD
ncbi:hypothetical protein B0H67DRAFT_649608 [Lasiosphaeris hirsuta]|uniref:DUF1168-domain-containing protein n=1 Tax=Lasiosphaeris hirsuta TaxID=260670 RepID=A0AA40DIW1_9PEZI|nr:hypothetical protein B0H67DRAFT_649608 [Lasiosphaeris hirsuta]